MAGIAFWKAVTTLGIWGGVVAISITTSSNVMGVSSTVPAVIGMIAATIITSRLWWEPSHASESRQRIPSGSDGKAKRGAYANPDSKMRLLLELMDEDEREAFKETLRRQVLDNLHASRDGELPYDATSLEDLMDDEPRFRRR